MVPTVLVKKRRARPFWFGHPWVFSGAIERVDGGAPSDGDVVRLADTEGQSIGYGFWNGKSQIRVRMMTLDAEGPPDADLVKKRVQAALALRREVLRLPETTTAYRLIHAEGDGLPGLVADFLGGYVVIQVSSVGIAAHVETVLDALTSALDPPGILERPTRVANEEGLERPFQIHRGSVPEGPVTVEENGVRYLCDLVHGQKTGFFTDQRENRRVSSPLARDRTVLDVFCSSGGFGVRMAKEGAKSVLLVDSSEHALALATDAAALNECTDRITVERAKAQNVLQRLIEEKRRFGVVVLDPPALVPKKKDLDKGLQRYAALNSAALDLLEPEGLLVTCSCSQHVGESEFEDALLEAAHRSQKRCQEIYRGGQGPDHPVLHPHFESRYLKCRVLRVP